MYTVAARIMLVCLVFSIFFPSLLPAATERRIALVIGNSSYSTGPLKNPVNDAADMAAALEKSGFAVTLKKNANLREMMESIEEFGKTLQRGGVGLFYYAGHGVQIGGVNYLIPIGARINKEGDVRYEAVDAGRVLMEMEYADNGLNIVVLDACRDNPYTKSFRSVSRGLAIVTNAPTGTFISYSTGAGQVAMDGTERNSPYTKALLENIVKPGLSITKVFMNVRSKVMKETGQVPWELSSLVGDFYFVRGTAKIVGGGDSKALAPAATDRETKRDRFIAYDNGTVLDTRTNLMWAAQDDGGGVNWADAKSYCEKYNRGGYTDWRMPTQSELAELYDETSSGYIPRCADVYKDYVRVTDLIKVSCYGVWASETRDDLATYFSLVDARARWLPRSFDAQALPVRSAK